MKSFAVLALSAVGLGIVPAASATPPPSHPAPTPALPQASPQTAPAKPANAASGARSGKPTGAPSGAPPGASAPGGKATADSHAGGPPSLRALVAESAPRAALRQLMLQPYAEATGTTLGESGWDGANLDAALKPAGAQDAPASDPPPDLVLVSGGQEIAGCKSQLLARVDWALLGKDRYLPQAVQDCGAGAFVSALALAWDRDKLSAAPNWGDFWDVARHPGGRGLPRTARFDLEIALLADGVAASDIYRTLRTADGLDRAFRKLDQLKPYIIWWDTPEQPAEMLAAGHVLLTASPTAPLLREGDASHRKYGLQWAGSVMELYYWAVPQSAAHPTAAATALLIAADIARQAEFGRATDLGPAITRAVDLLPPGPRAASPSTPANMADTLFVDEQFWLENEDKLQARLEAWAAK